MQAYGEVKKICREAYRDFVKGAPIPDELKRALRTHERVPTFIDNLARDISNVPKLTREVAEQATRELARVFLANVVREAEERVMSPLKKAMKRAQIDKAREIQKHADALEERGEINVTQDKAGNETSTQKIVLEKDDIGRLGLS